VLNNCVGFVFAEMVDGRYPVRLAEYGDQVGVKPRNLVVIEEVPQDLKKPKPKPCCDFSGKWKLVRTRGMSKFLRSQGMSWLKTKLQLNPKLSISIEQDGLKFKMVFTSRKGALTDEFVAASDEMISANEKKARTKASKAVIIENEFTKDKMLKITEANRKGEEKTIIFTKRNAETLQLQVTNNAGATMFQEFQKVTQ